MNYYKTKDGVVVEVRNAPHPECPYSTDMPIECGMVVGNRTDAELAAARVEVDRKAKIAAFLKRTADLLDAGFEFPAGSGHRHSLDDRRIATYGETQKNKNAFTNLPVITNDKKVIRLADAAAIDSFYAAGLARSMAIRIVGAELIEAANAATTTAELEAIVDDRT